jgi:hypothetical protein
MLGVDDGEGRLGRTIKTGGRHLSGQPTVGAGQYGANRAAGTVGPRQAAGIGQGQGFQRHHLGQSTSFDSAQALGQVQATQGETVEHVEHGVGPTPVALGLADVRCELAAGQTFGRGA